MSTRVFRMLGLTVLFTVCIAGRVSAELENAAYERFYSRYVGTWKLNTAKSRVHDRRTAEGGTLFTYVAIPGQKGIRYNGGAVHMLDGKDITSTRPGATLVREVLDEFTIVTSSKQNGRVTGRNTFVLSPDGKFGAFVVLEIDEKGAPAIRSLQYFEKQ